MAMIAKRNGIASNRLSKPVDLGRISPVLAGKIAVSFVVLICALEADSDKEPPKGGTPSPDKIAVAGSSVDAGP